MRVSVCVSLDRLADLFSILTQSLHVCADGCAERLHEDRLLERPAVPVNGLRIRRRPAQHLHECVAEDSAGTNARLSETARWRGRPQRYVEERNRKCQADDYWSEGA